MRYRSSFTIVIGLLASLFLVDTAAAYYSPSMGRFLSRDPIHEPGSVLVRSTANRSSFIPRDPVGGNADSNLYRYVDNSPTVFVDSLGLWKIDRDGGAYAYVTPEKGDTVEELAQLIGLEAADYKNWMTQLSNQAWAGPPLPTSTSQVVDQCGIWKVPNTVVAWWGGELGGFGKFWVMWDTDVNTFKKRGFKVIDTGPGTAAGIEGDIANYQGQKQLHGIFFWGHGYQGGVLTDSDNKGTVGYYSDYANWHPPYKMAIGIVFACHSASAQQDFSQNAIFWGKTGVLIPHGFHVFGPTVAELVPPGSQGTK